MKHIISLHLSDNHLRILSLLTTPSSQSVESCSAINISSQSFPPDMRQIEIPNEILTAQNSPLVITLGGGFFHLQRVPLEVASESDRKAQITWEASQVLIDPIDSFDIDFLPAGRVAFWTAIRKDITQTYIDYFSDLGFSDIKFVTEPFALYALNKSIQNNKSQGAIWLGAKWGSFIAQSPNALTTAETIDLQGKPHNGLQNLPQIKQWIQGDLNTERRRPTFDNILLCGEQSAVEALTENLTDANPPHLMPFDWSQHMSHITNASDISTPNEFALALGAAIELAQ